MKKSTRSNSRAGNGSRAARTVLMGAFAVTAALGAGLARAASDGGVPGWYGGLSINSTGLGVHSGDLDNALSSQGITGSSTVSRHDTTMGLQLGYRLNRNFAVEGGYTDLGKYGFSSSVSAPAADNVNGNWKANAWSLSGLGIMPLADKWSAFGRLGVTRTEASFNPSSQSGATAPGSAVHHGTGLVFGGGANYDINKDWFGRAEADRYTNVGDASTGKGSVDALAVGVGMRF